MTGSDIVIALLRCLNLVGLAMFAGAMFVRVVLVPFSGLDLHSLRAFGTELRRLCWLSLAVSSVGLILWVPLQLASLSGVDSFTETLALLPEGLTGTAFGMASCLRALAIAISALLLFYAVNFYAVRVGLLLAAVLALGLQIRMGHATAADSVWLPVAVLAHIIAGALWFGSLMPLYLLLNISRDAGLRAARCFSVFGITFVTVLVAGAAVAGWLLTGGIAGLIGTAYGKIIIVKIVLFAAMLTLAAFNRFRLSRVGSSGQGLRYALFGEAIIGLAVFIAASLLATQPPAVHEDVIWPFNNRLRDNILSDPFLVDAAWRSFRPIIFAVLIGIGCLFLPKMRWPIAIIVAFAGFIFFQPLRTELFLQDANEASFLRSPTSYTSIAISRGATAFNLHCSSCHGNDGRGRGEQATGDPVWPPDLTAPYFADRSDGEIFWTIMSGKELKDGRQSMPGFEHALDSKTAWSLVDYIRTIAAARTIGLPAPDGEVYPAASPRISAYCGEKRYEVGRPSDNAWLLDLHGQHVSVFAVDGSGGKIKCDVPDLTAVVAMQLLTSEPSNTSFLVDQNGWIRFRWSAIENMNPETLSTAILKARENPVRLSGKGHHAL